MRDSRSSLQACTAKARATAASRPTARPGRSEYNLPDRAPTHAHTLHNVTFLLAGDMAGCALRERRGEPVGSGRDRAGTGRGGGRQGGVGPWGSWISHRGGQGGPTRGLGAMWREAIEAGLCAAGEKGPGRGPSAPRGGRGGGTRGAGRGWVSGKEESIGRAGGDHRPPPLPPLLSAAGCGVREGDR